MVRFLHIDFYNFMLFLLFTYGRITIILSVHRNSFNILFGPCGLYGATGMTTKKKETNKNNKTNDICPSFQVLP